jgi:hypothetical protein
VLLDEPAAVDLPIDLAIMSVSAHPATLTVLVLGVAPLRAIERDGDDAVAGFIDKSAARRRVPIEFELFKGCYHGFDIVGRDT